MTKHTFTYFPSSFLPALAVAQVVLALVDGLIFSGDTDDFEYNFVG